jgi:hypothetical protein
MTPTCTIWRRSSERITNPYTTRKRTLTSARRHGASAGASGLDDPLRDPDERIDWMKWLASIANEVTD